MVAVRHILRKKLANNWKQGGRARHQFVETLEKSIGFLPGLWISKQNIAYFPHPSIFVVAVGDDDDNNDDDDSY